MKYNGKYASHIAQMSSTIDIFSFSLSLAVCVCHIHLTLTLECITSHRNLNRRQRTEEKNTKNKNRNNLCVNFSVSLRLFSQIYRWKLETGHTEHLFVSIQSRLVLEVLLLLIHSTAAVFKK